MGTDEKSIKMLSPYRALDLTDEKGCFCGKILAALGADVIKIEKPGGDSARSIGPFYNDVPHPEKSLYWYAFNIGKRSITLDIETADGQNILKRLIERADIVIESFAPGYLDKLGLGYAVLSQINPGVILTSITGFGQEGPYRDYKGQDITLWSMSGNTYLYGDPDRPPLAPSFPLARQYSAAEAVVGTLVALYQRRDTGKGQHVDVPVQLSLVRVIGPEAHGLWDFNHRNLKRRGGGWLIEQTGVRMRTIYKCKDGYISYSPYYGGSQGKGNLALLEWMEKDGVVSPALKKVDLPTLDWYKVHQDFADEYMDCLNRFFIRHTKKELSEGAAERKIQLYPIFTPGDLLKFPQLSARGYWVGIEHPELDATITYPGAFFKSTETEYQIGCRAPLIGEHNAEIYEKELGFSAEDLVVLKQARVI